MDRYQVIRMAALLGFFGVCLGAFGAHGLEEILVKHGRLGNWETAVKYQLVHAVALLGLAGSGIIGRSRLIIFSWVTGTLTFSGSLYCLCLSNVRMWGAVTPIGGILLLVGWAKLFHSSFVFRKD